jgi:hypothetical protein
MSRTALALLLLPLPALLTGCPGIEIADPVWEIQPDEALVVMPFKDPDFPGRWDSPRGHQVAQQTTEALQREADFQTRPYDDVLALFQAEDVNKLSPRDVAALTKADYVLVCEFEQLRLKDPLSVNIRQGEAKVKVRLFKVERRTPADEEKERKQQEEQEEARRRAHMPSIPFDRGGVYLVQAERTIEVKYPSDFMSPGGEPFLKEPDIEAGLLAATARKVAKLYYPHQVEKIETD